MVNECSPALQRRREPVLPVLCPESNYTSGFRIILQPPEYIIPVSSVKRNPGLQFTGYLPVKQTGGLENHGIVSIITGRQCDDSCPDSPGKTAWSRIPLLPAKKNSFAIILIQHTNGGSMKQLITAAVVLAMLIGKSPVSAQTQSFADHHHHWQDRLTIGVMFIASGVMGGYGRHGRQAVELAVEEINTAGGILGRPVRFLFEDTELNAGKIEQIAQRFIQEERVDFLIGPTSSGLAVTLSQIAKENQVPLVLAQAASASLTGAGFHPYLFGTLSNSMMHSRAGAYVGADLPLNNWMVIGPDYNYGHSSWEMFIDKLQELKPGVTVAGELFPPLMCNDFTSYINEIIATAPEAVWAPLWGNDAVKFIRQAIDIDADLFNRVKFFVPDGASLEVLDPVGPDMPDGIYMSSRYYFASPHTQENSAFIQSYLTRFGEMPDYMACETYAAVYFIKAAVERAKSKRADRIIAAVEREPLAWNTPEGWKIMRREDHQVVEDVLWGQTSFTEGNTRSDLKNILSIQGEIICRTQDELQQINPAIAAGQKPSPDARTPGSVYFINHARRPMSTFRNLK